MCLFECSGRGLEDEWFIVESETSQVVARVLLPEQRAEEISEDCSYSIAAAMSVYGG